MFEGYLNLLLFSLAKVMCKFRCSDHKLPIEQGRFFGIDRNQRFYTLCNSNQLGDDYHYIFQCNFFAADRHKYLSTFCRQAVNTYKYAFLMNSTETNGLKKPALFLKSIMFKF